MKTEKESNYINAMWGITIVILLTTILGIFLINTNKQDTNIVTKGSTKIPEPYYYNIDTLALKRDWCGRVSHCRVLAEVGYYEARGETDIGAIAVMQVVMNRVEGGGIFRNQNDIQVVVNKKHQFSFKLDGSMDKPIDYKQMDRMLVLAHDVLHRNIGDVTNESLYYHANYVNPRWASYYEYAVTIGNHIFYK